jgi:hypothetical protein
MVATAIDLTRGEIDQDNFDELFSQTKFTLPLAPSEGNVSPNTPVAQSQPMGQ